MKTIHLITLLYCALIFCCPAQSNLALTNDVLINESWTRQMLVSYSSLVASSNSIIAAISELQADDPLFWMLHNTNFPNNGGGALMPEYNRRFVFELKTTNGFSIQKTERGKTMSQPPKSLTDSYTGYPGSVAGGYKHYDFPALTNLFNFPSNGVYVFELRCWAWQNSKKCFALSDPIRVKVIAQTINTTNSVLNPKLKPNL